MMNLVEIDIGKPPHKEGYNDNDGWQCSAVTLALYGEILSHNDVSYWFSLDQYNIGGRIAKNSPEGQKLSKMIAVGTSIAYVQNYLVQWCLERMTPGQLIRILKWVSDESFKRGKNAVRQSLASLLEIE